MKLLDKYPSIAIILVFAGIGLVGSFDYYDLRTAECAAKQQSYKYWRDVCAPK